MCLRRRPFGRHLRVTTLTKEGSVWRQALRSFAVSGQARRSAAASLAPSTKCTCHVAHRPLRPPDKDAARAGFSGEQFRQHGSVARLWPSPAHECTCLQTNSHKGGGSILGPRRTGGGRTPFLPRSSLCVSIRSHGTHPVILGHHAQPPEIK